MKKLNIGIIYAVLCYFFWGFFPIYWKWLQHVPPLEIFCHRIIWSYLFYTLLLSVKERKLILFTPLKIKNLFYIFLASSFLLINWLIYIQAVNSGHIVETSLGYFINPLVNVLIGIFFFKESLQRHHFVSLGLATFGVAIITLSQGQIPWIALILAITFSIYGSFKKTITLSGIKSNQIETLIYFIPAFIYLLFQDYHWLNRVNSSTGTFLTVLLLIGSGVVTGLPLIFFAEATQKVPYYLMGFFQFIAPTLQFLSGVLIFHESLSHQKMIGFIFIWISMLYLILFGRSVKK